MLDGGTVETFVPSASTLVPKGQASETLVTRSSFSHSALGVYDPDGAYIPVGTGCAIFVWDTLPPGSPFYGNTGAVCTIIDLASGAEMVSAQLVASHGANPRVCVIGSAAFVVYSDSSSHNIYCVKVTSSGGTWTFAAPVLLFSAAAQFEITAISDRFFVAASVGTTAPVITVKSYDWYVSLIATGHTVNSISVAYTGIGLRAGTIGFLWMSYCLSSGGNNSIYWEAFDPIALTGLTSAFLIYTSTSDLPMTSAIEVPTANTAAFVYTVRTSRTLAGISYVGTVIRADVFNTLGAHLIHGANRETGFSSLASKPVAVSVGGSTKVYAWA